MTTHEHSIAPLKTFANSTESSFFAAFCASLLIVFFFWSKPPVTLGFDPNKEKCLTDMHLSLILHYAPRVVHDDDYVIFLPAGPLAYVKQEFVLKQVAAVAGDHVRIAGGKIFVNDRVVATGLPLASLYHKGVRDLERDEVVPPGQVFVLGNHPNSDDSRYWGYLPLGKVTGTAIKLL